SYAFARRRISHRRGSYSRQQPTLRQESAAVGTGRNGGCGRRHHAPAKRGNGLQSQGGHDRRGREHPGGGRPPRTARRAGETGARTAAEEPLMSWFRTNWLAFLGKTRTKFVQSGERPPCVGRIQQVRTNHDKSGRITTKPDEFRPDLKLCPIVSD